MDKVQHLQQTGLFSEVAPTDLEILAAVIQPIWLTPEEVLFHLGEQGDRMYIIISGRIRIFLPETDQAEMTITHYGELDIVGEFALFDQQPRSASAAAVGETLVFMLHQADLVRFLETHPQASFAMMRSLAQRARYTTRYLEEVTKWAKRLAQGDYETALQEITASTSHESDSIQDLVSTFLKMARHVQAQEAEFERLRLKIEIDEAQRQAAFQQLLSGGLLEKARQMKADFQQFTQS